MSDEIFSLKGKSALITGDNRFWYRYIVAALAKAGAKVAVASSDPLKLDELKRGTNRFTTEIVPIVVDVTISTQVGQMVKQAISELGKIDILVNTCDPQFFRSFMETTIDEWTSTISDVTTSLFLCCQAVGKYMLARKYGRIINITSCLAERGIINGAAYCTAMATVPALTRALSLEWAREGITINAVGAGWFSEQEKLNIEKENQLLRFLPMKRYGHPSEIGSLIVYLASDAAAYYSGQTIYVDGVVMAHG
jgi:NAD(P)-dependent dehydrogenase (short-subunit alcohol dehydrogenase family)